MNKFPLEVDGRPTLGFLVSYRLKEAAISLSEYADFLDDAAGSKEDIEILRVKRRLAQHAYKQALREVAKRHDNRNRNTRYLFRPDKVGGDRSKRQLVKETYLPGVKKPTHEVVGTVWLDRATEMPTWTHAAPNETVDAILAEVGTAFDAASTSFPSSTLRDRFGRLVSDCLPVAYDAEHVFKFVFAEHVARLELIDSVVSFLNEKAGVASETRSSRSDLAVLALPDQEHFRGTVGNAYSEEIQDLAATVKAAVKEYRDGGLTNTDVLMRAIKKIKDAKAILKRYEQDFQGAAGNVALTLMEVQEQARVLLGRDEEPGGSHTLSWKVARTCHPLVQTVLGDALVKLDNTFPVVRAHGEVISWRKGLGEHASARLTQTAINDTLAVHLTALVLDLPGALQAHGFKRNILGWTYSGLVTADLIKDILSWWESDIK